MDSPTMERQQLIEAVRVLPDEVLLELASFLDYLQYKSLQHKSTDRPSNFLTAIAGLGQSDQKDTSERDEEILSTEIDSIRGWNFGSSTQA